MIGLFISTDELMAQLLLANRNETYTFEEMQYYSRYLWDKLPISAMINVDYSDFEDTLEEYPEVFKRSGEGKFTCSKLLPNKKYFFRRYNEDYREYMLRISKLFVDTELGKLRSRLAKERLLGVIS